ncbi:MAG: tRNA (adenosine(37)-N6)-threonylcarbamoyltransferase complex ATPase subunit type 1 TsaE [Clostridia bacterium]|nr:tRNA (adenosine(37)-N6)-threonylcarbamoyltransferase complex ATPase subunit type 1 TsaE [Clostridia bacterium]MDD4685751.1 tRNA (adenosine(37)-N6)-threonylcarbamoyltransferase complex ATPase subunit type 1 TsaE [Clostridia bacterium]
MKIKVITKSPEETMLLAQKIARSVQEPCVISLVGDLSAGKTTFSKGFALGLGIKEIVTSPTFTILNEYESEEVKLLHFDMYKLNSIEEAYELGFEEYFDIKKLNGIVLVEWAENVKGLLPTFYYEISFTKLSDNERAIEIMQKGEKNNKDEK